MLCITNLFVASILHPASSIVNESIICICACVLIMVSQLAIAIGHTKKYGHHQSKVLPLEDRWQCQGYPQGHMRGSKPWLPDPPTLIASPWIIEHMCKLCPGMHRPHPSYALPMNVPNHITQCLLTIASSKLFIFNKFQLIMNLYVLDFWFNLPQQLWFIFAS